jgi:hypothetical protein
MLPFVTVFNNLASINILDAAPQVVAAPPGMTPERLQQVRRRRWRSSMRARRSWRDQPRRSPAPRCCSALQRRSAVGGTIQSSRVDVSGIGAKNGLVDLVVSCEIEQPALQTLLYDIEAAMPFLFVDQLDVQVPQTTATNEGATGRIRVVLGVSGQWYGSGNK